MGAWGRSLHLAALAMQLRSMPKKDVLSTLHLRQALWLKVPRSRQTLRPQWSSHDGGTRKQWRYCKVRCIATVGWLYAMAESKPRPVRSVAQSNCNSRARAHLPLLSLVLNATNFDHMFRC